MKEPLKVTVTVTTSLVDADGKEVASSNLSGGYANLTKADVVKLELAATAAIHQLNLELNAVQK